MTKESAVATRRASPTTVDQWLDQQQTDPRRRMDIDAQLEEMRLEQSLITLREARGLSQRELAERAGVNQPMIARIESGQVRNIEIRTLLRLVTAMGGKVKIHVRKDPAWDKVVPLRRRRAAAG